MLFSEHIQLTYTGSRKVQLEEKKYHQIAEQFALACKIELLKREEKISAYSIHHLFNPNIKTTLQMSQEDLKRVPETLKEKLKSLVKNERHSEQQ